jgi:hypothetical protein
VRAISKLFEADDERAHLREPFSAVPRPWSYSILAMAISQVSRTLTFSFSSAR